MNAEVRDEVYAPQQQQKYTKDNRKMAPALYKININTYIILTLYTTVRKRHIITENLYVLVCIEFD